ncbi:50S ribosomal protein L25/general stress protein Ctc [Kroppenstedtia eburnea]|uniref:Large ribosomal subunit protein bL25 n=1 Tax=Kroppenstedtia eburnea TaxID=714067 RepID=A0A1N7MTN1_9BACL|nr:50S ribosomal protein L25/general stress protein Ctc [Kroppenstedtia eburnea]QKI80646.1 50S ribosomal protein L25/general stress protein Ctc [Kroppenstedtia eburnea]SIS89368.1 large subunit ribosomal protein L25 [Kroppenstedtia eburnea]
MAYPIAVTIRQKYPRSLLTKLRREGRVPAVVYGKGMENELIHLEAGQVIKMLQQEGTSAIYELQYPGGKSRQVMIRELQQDRIKDKIIHIDFNEVKLDEPIDTEVYIELTGEPTGVKEGGILQHQLRSVEVRCLPADLPDRLEGEITHLAIGDTLTAGELPIPDRVELLTDPEEMVATVLPPRMERDADETEEAMDAPTETEEKE